MCSRTKHDAEAIKPILNHCTNIINLIDKSPPDVIYSVACKCKLIISNDTGPGHIASLSGVNTLWLALDNPITKANLSFRKNNHLVLKNSMKDLSVDEVKEFILIINYFRKFINFYLDQDRLFSKLDSLYSMVRTRMMLFGELSAS